MRPLLLLAAAALLTPVIGQPALAADMAVKAPIVAAPIAYSWTGFYIGANVGYAWGRTNDDVNFLPTAAAFGALPFSVSSNMNGVLGGVQAGYNVQFDRAVLGFEADIDAADIKGSQFLTPLSPFVGAPVPGWFHSGNQRMDWFGTFRARLGYTPVDRWLFYVTGGLAYGEVKSTSFTSFTPLPPFQYAASTSSWRAGWTVGAGGEWAFADNWNVRLEYLHYDLGTSQDATAQPLAPNGLFAVTNHWTTRGDLVRVGVNYKFGGAPLVARY